jgi:HxlR-like helix-turn-helix
MKIETLLPLGKVDPGLRAPDAPLDIKKIGEQAKLVESLGYDALMTEETKDDPFVVMALAAQALTLALRKLEQKGLVIRRMFVTFPPRVEYELTDGGRDLWRGKL